MRLRLVHLLPVLAFCCATASEAATYYVRNGGSDSADGRSHATAWASLGKINNHSFSPGDQVLLHEGHRWVGRVELDWAGTSTAHAVLGAYYLDGSTPKRGYRTAPPTIDGEDRLPTESKWTPLVLIRANRVRVENLRVINSEGRGIGAASVSDPEVVGCSVSNIRSGGIHFLKTQGGRAENNRVTRTDAGYPESGGTVDWGAAIAIVTSRSTVIRNNTVAEVWGEGINAHSGSQYTLIERNYVFGARSAGVYSDAAPDTTIRRNIIVGTANSSYWRNGSTVGPGIVLSNEVYHYPAGGGSQDVSIQSKRARIYGNLVANTSEGIGIWGGGFAETSYDDMRIYNNTLVDNTIQVTMSTKPKPGAQFYNNILLSLSGGTTDISGLNLNGMTAKNNYFSKGDPGGGYSSSSNRYTGLELAKMSGWRAVNSPDQVSWRDFVVLSGSPVIGAGSDEPWQASTGDQDYRLDHNKAEFSLPMDMGGLTFATPPGPRPMAPTALSGT